MVDLLAVCAHPDDLEAGLGGMFLKANLEGLCTGLIVFTKGESGGYTDKETRVREATEAAKILQLDYFKLLDFPDAGLYYEKAAVKALIPLLRECAPRYVFTMLQEDYHPDHVAVSRITENACFTAGLKLNSKDNTEWHYEGLLYFSADERTNRRKPDIYIDISDVAEGKKRMCAAHGSQNILSLAMSAAEAYGRIAGVRYAEGLYLRSSFLVHRPMDLFGNHQK